MKSFQLLFDDAVFYAGENVSGKVKIELEVPLHLTSISITVKGFCEFRISTEVAKVSDREEYFKLKKNIWESDPEIKQPISTGSHEFPFSIRLPLNIPTSVSTSDGLVEYNCKTEMRNGTILVQPSVTRTFNVSSTLDLNSIPEARKPSYAMDERTGYSCFLFRKEYYLARLSVPKTGYIVKDEIPFYAEIINDRGRSIKYTEVELKKVVTFVINDRSCSFPFTVAKLRKGKINPHTKVDWAEPHLVVPEVPPSTPQGSNHTSISYKLEFNVYMKSDVFRKLEIPLFIGTSPLRNESRSVSITETGNNLLPVTPLIDNIPSTQLFTISVETSSTSCHESSWNPEDKKT